MSADGREVFTPKAFTAEQGNRLAVTQGGKGVVLEREGTGGQKATPTKLSI